MTRQGGDRRQAPKMKSNRGNSRAQGVRVTGHDGERVELNKGVPVYAYTYECARVKKAKWKPTHCVSCKKPESPC